MAVYPVSSCVHHFELCFGLIKEKEGIRVNVGGSPSEKPSSKDEQDTLLLERTIFNYSKKETCCGKVKRFFYLVWQAVKKFFCAAADWQKTNRMLSDRLIKGFDYGAMTEDQKKGVTADVGVVVENLLLQLLEANEKNKGGLDDFQVRTSSHKGELRGFDPKDAFASILRVLARTCFVTKRCKDFIASLPAKVQKRVNDKLEFVDTPEQIKMIQAFETHCKKDPNYAEKTKQKVTENYEEMEKLEREDSRVSAEILKRNAFENAYDAALTEAFGVENIFNYFSR